MFTNSEAAEKEECSSIPVSLTILPAVAFLKSLPLLYQTIVVLLQKERMQSRHRMKALEEELTRMKAMQDSLTKKMKSNAEVCI